MPRQNDKNISFKVTQIWIHKLLLIYKSYKHLIILDGLENTKELIILYLLNNSHERKNDRVIRVWIIKINSFLFFIFFKYFNCSGEVSI